MTYFAIISTILFFLLGIIWSRNNWTNLSIKIFFFFMTFWGTLVSLNLLGYVYK